MKLHKIPENQKPLPAPCPYFPAQSPGGLDEFCRETAGNRKDCSLIYTWRRQCERWQLFVLLPVFGLKSRSCGKKASGQLSGGRTQAWTQISVAARAIDRAIRQQRSGTPPRIAGSDETWPGCPPFLMMPSSPVHVGQPYQFDRLWHQSQGCLF